MCNVINELVLRLPETSRLTETKGEKSVENGFGLRLGRAARVRFAIVLWNDVAIEGCTVDLYCWDCLPLVSPLPFSDPIRPRRCSSKTS